MQKSKDDDYTSVNNSLAHELLSEEELRYFAGEKKQKNKLILSIFSKRKAANTTSAASIDHDLVKTLDESNPKTDPQPDNLKPNSKQASSQSTSIVSTKQGSGLKVIGASVGLVLLLLLVAVLGLKLSDSSSNSKNLTAIKDKAVVDSSDKLQITNKETVIANSAATTVNGANKVDKQLDHPIKKTKQNNDIDKIPTTSTSNENSDAQTTLAAKSAANVSLDNTNKPRLETTPELAGEPQTLANDIQTSVSYEDFAKEAQSTIYRDSDN